MLINVSICWQWRLFDDRHKTYIDPASSRSSIVYTLEMLSHLIVHFPSLLENSFEFKCATTSEEIENHFLMRILCSQFFFIFYCIINLRQCDNEVKMKKTFTLTPQRKPNPFYGYLIEKFLILCDQTKICWTQEIFHNNLVLRLNFRFTWSLFTNLSSTRG